MTTAAHPMTSGGAGRTCCGSDRWPVDCATYGANDHHGAGSDRLRCADGLADGHRWADVPHGVLLAGSDRWQTAAHGIQSTGQGQNCVYKIH